MRISKRIIGVALCLLCLSISVYAQRPNPQGMPFGGMPPMGGMMPMGGMGGFNWYGVDFAKEVPAEDDKVIKDKADSLHCYYAENIDFGDAIKIRFSGDEVQVEGATDDVRIEKDGAYINVTSDAKRPLSFELSGKTDNGSLSFNVSSPMKLLLNNLTLKSKRGDAILVGSKTAVYAVLAEGSVNELSDCPNPEMPPMMMGGPGMGGPQGMPPAMDGNMPPMMMPQHKGEENPADYHEMYGQRMKKPKMKKKLKIDGTFVCTGSLAISGKGTLTVQSNNKVGIKSKASMMLRASNMITVRALSGKGVNAKDELYIHGGALNVDCSFSSDKALTAGRNMYIRGGHVVVRAGGGESSEGIESKFLMQIDGGTVEVAAFDDAVNAQGNLVINGGVVRAYSIINDAFDSNCNMIVNGGDIFACGNGMPEGGLDCDDERGYRLFVNGGTVVAVGGRHSMPEAQSRQPSVLWYMSDIAEGKTYSISDVCSYKSVRAYPMGGATLFFSSPKLKKGKSYTLNIDGKESGKLDSLTMPFSMAR